MAKKRVYVTGVKEINRSIRQASRSMHRSAENAVVDVVADVQRWSMKNTPIRTSNLQNSHRSKVRRAVTRIVGTIYLLANYALFVHEARPETQFKSPWPRGRKFLERAFTDNMQRIKETIVRWFRR